MVAIAVFRWVVEAVGLAVAVAAIADCSYLSDPPALLEMIAFFLVVPTVRFHQKRAAAIVVGYRLVLANDCWAGDWHLDSYW